MSKQDEDGVQATIPKQSRSTSPSYIRASAPRTPRPSITTGFIDSLFDEATHKVHVEEGLKVMQREAMGLHVPRPEFSYTALAQAFADARRETAAITIQRCFRKWRRDERITRVWQHVRRFIICCKAAVRRRYQPAVEESPEVFPDTQEEEEQQQELEGSAAAVDGDHEGFNQLQAHAGNISFKFCYEAPAHDDNTTQHAKLSPAVFGSQQRGLTALKMNVRNMAMEDASDVHDTVALQPQLNQSRTAAEADHHKDDDMGYHPIVSFNRRASDDQRCQQFGQAVDTGPVVCSTLPACASSFQYLSECGSQDLYCSGLRAVSPEPVSPTRKSFTTDNVQRRKSASPSTDASRQLQRSQGSFALVCRQMGGMVSMQSVDQSAETPLEVHVAKYRLPDLQGRSSKSCSGALPCALSEQLSQLAQPIVTPTAIDTESDADLSVRSAGVRQSMPVVDPGQHQNQQGAPQQLRQVCVQNLSGLGLAAVGRPAFTTSVKPVPSHSVHRTHHIHHKHHHHQNPARSSKAQSQQLKQLGPATLSGNSNDNDNDDGITPWEDSKPSFHASPPATGTYSGPFSSAVDLDITYVGIQGPDPEGKHDQTPAVTAAARSAEFYQMSSSALDVDLLVHRSTSSQGGYLRDHEERHTSPALLTRQYNGHRNPDAMHLDLQAVSDAHGVPIELVSTPMHKQLMHVEQGHYVNKSAQGSFTSPGTSRCASPIPAPVTAAGKQHVALRSSVSSQGVCSTNDDNDMPSDTQQVRHDSASQQLQTGGVSTAANEGAFDCSQAQSSSCAGDQVADASISSACDGMILTLLLPSTHDQHQCADNGVATGTKWSPYTSVVMTPPRASPRVSTRRSGALHGSVLRSSRPTTNPTSCGRQRFSSLNLSSDGVLRSPGPRVPSSGQTQHAQRRASSHSQHLQVIASSGVEVEIDTSPRPLSSPNTRGRAITDEVRAARLAALHDQQERYQSVWRLQQGSIGVTSSHAIMSPRPSAGPCSAAGKMTPLKTTPCNATANSPAKRVTQPGSATSGVASDVQDGVLSSFSAPIQLQTRRDSMKAHTSQHSASAAAAAIAAVTGGSPCSTKTLRRSSSRKSSATAKDVKHAPPADVMHRSVDHDVSVQVKSCDKRLGQDRADNVPVAPITFVRVL